MNTIAALLKKEIHTAKWFLLGGALFFWSFPLLEGIGNYLHGGTARSEISGPMAIIFGAFYAIVTAGGVVCLDMPKGLYIFWRSRPIHLAPHMVVKYLAGLIVVLFVIVMPTLMLAGRYDSAVSANPVSFEWSILCIHIPILILAYSIAFFAGHVFGNMTETVIISCAATLLVYFVPVLVPVLEPVSYFSLITSGGPATSTESLLLHSFYLVRELWIFNGTAALLCAGLIAGTWICLKRHIQIRLGLKTLSWCLGLVSLILFSAAAFSIGTNLKCLAQSSLSVGRSSNVINACFDEKGGVLLGGYYRDKSRDYDKLYIDRISEEPSYTYQHDSFVLEKQLPTQSSSYAKKRIAWTYQQPEIVYYLGISQTEKDSRSYQQFNLYTIKLDNTANFAVVQHELPLGEYDAEELGYYEENVTLAGKTLNILLPDSVAVVDIDSDAAPRLLTKTAHSDYAGKELVLPGSILLSKEQPRDAAQYFAQDNYQTNAWDGNRYVSAGKNFVCVYKTSKGNDRKMVQEKIAEYRKMPLENLMFGSSKKVILKGDKVFQLNVENSLTVFHLNESAGTLKRIGHYAAPKGYFYDMFLRQDGLIALVGTSQIHIIQPPAAKKN